jgi:hypothetical protein
MTSNVDEPNREEEELAGFEKKQSEELEAFKKRQQEELQAFERKEHEALEVFEHRERLEFEIRIDRTEYEVSQREMTGLQLRNLVHPPIGPDRDLFEVVLGGGSKIPAVSTTRNSQVWHRYIQRRFPVFLMTYGRCEGSKSFGPQAVSFRTARASSFLKRSEQRRCPKQDPRTCSPCSKASQGTRPGPSRSNQSRQDIFGIFPDQTANDRSRLQRFVQVAELLFGLDLHFCALFGRKGY